MIGSQAMAYYPAGRGVPLLARDCVQHPEPYGVGMRPVQEERVAGSWTEECKDRGPLCFHGLPANSIECQKDGLYKGKMLWLCAAEGEKCQLFLEEADLTNPKCRCDVHTRENVVKKETVNQGRKFLSCGARKCKYFKWL